MEQKKLTTDEGKNESDDLNTKEDIDRDVYVDVVDHEHRAHGHPQDDLGKKSIKKDILACIHEYIHIHTHT